MSKFKVGDKVKIRKDSMYYRDTATNPKDTRGEVKSVNSCGSEIEVMWDNGFLNVYSESDLEFWRFTKADLKDGMRCIDREGDVWYVCGYSMVKPAAGVVRPFIDWCNDLTGRFYNSLDIMRVIDRDGTVLFDNIIIHENEEPTELTIEEIAEKFGLPVERVRIKK